MKTGLPGRATQARASAPAGPTNPPGGIMRDGPVWFAALAAIGIGVLLWERRRERKATEHLDLSEFALTQDDAPEHRVWQFVVVNRNHKGHVIYCERCRRYLLSGKTITDHAEATKNAEWHLRAHQMEAV